jgi:hypothetical protein
MASLADYVLSLARDRNEAEKFRASQQSAKQAMTAFGLSNEHQEILLSGDPNRISQEVQKEFAPWAHDPGWTNTQCMVNVPIPKTQK